MHKLSQKLYRLHLDNFSSYEKELDDFVQLLSDNVVDERLEWLSLCLDTIFEKKEFDLRIDDLLCDVTSLFADLECFFNWDVKDVGEVMTVTFKKNKMIFYLHRTGSYRACVRFFH